MAVPLSNRFFDRNRPWGQHWSAQASRGALPVKRLRDMDVESSRRRCGADVASRAMSMNRSLLIRVDTNGRACDNGLRLLLL
jgi:hypothetical protein